MMDSEKLEKIKELTKVSQMFGENEIFVIDAKEVAKELKKSLNAVYTSRKLDKKLDKLVIFEKIKNILGE
jgi:hypothetical protein